MQLTVALTIWTAIMDRLSEIADYLDNLADAIKDPELGPPAGTPRNLYKVALELRIIATENGYLTAPPM